MKLELMQNDTSLHNLTVYPSPTVISQAYICCSDSAPNPDPPPPTPTTHPPTHSSPSTPLLTLHPTPYPPPHSLPSTSHSSPPPTPHPPPHSSPSTPLLTLHPTPYPPLPTPHLHPLLTLHPLFTLHLTTHPPTHLSIEVYGVWQKVATHHRTQYLNAKV